METYEQKIERVATALWAAFGHYGAFPLRGAVRDKYLAGAKAALEEEARDIEIDTADDTAEAPKPKPKTKPTLPLTPGQRVVLRHGTIAIVSDNISGDAVTLKKEGGDNAYLGWFQVETGKWSRVDYRKHHPNDVVADAA